jgi:hypothetical protein
MLRKSPPRRLPARTRMPIARLSASRSKAELFQQLGWDEDDERFQEIYREMMVHFPARSTAALITA